MSYKMPIYTNEQIDEANKFPPLESGEYKFRVLSVECHTSDAGNHVKKIKLEVHHKPNKTMKCFHNLTLNNQGDDCHMWFIKKAKCFLDCIGVEYTEDAFDRIINREGRAKFLVNNYIDKQTGNERECFSVPGENGFLPESEGVKKSEPANVSHACNPDGSPVCNDDDIPF